MRGAFSTFLGAAKAWTIPLSGNQAGETVPGKGMAGCGRALIQ